MLDRSARGWRLLALAALCLLPAVAGAAEPASQPNAQSSGPAQEIFVNKTTLGRYVGHYRIGDPEIEAVLTVTLRGTRLLTQLTGEPAVEIYPRTPTHFFLKGADAELDFVTAGKDPASALILHQNGQNVTMPRLDDAAAAKFADGLVKRAAATAPQPGAEADVREVFDRMQKGLPANYAKMSPEIAAAAAAQADKAADMMASLGVLQSITFQGAPQGADVFLVKFDKGAVQVLIHLNSKGIIDGLLMQTAQ
ncbi:MAG: hypothetical protein WDM77_02605 [Steroidobacteraceae bacterium]